MIQNTFNYYALFEDDKTSISIPVLYFERVGEPLKKYNTNEVRGVIFTQGTSGKIETHSILHGDVINGKRFIGYVTNPYGDIQKGIYNDYTKYI